MVLGGIDEVCRYYIAYVYAVEIFKTAHASSAGIINFLIIAVFKVCICLGFMFASNKRWKPCGYTSIIFAFASFIFALLFLEESPRWLFDKGNYKKALQILRHI